MLFLSCSGAACHHFFVISVPRLKKANVQNHPIFIMDFHDFHDATNVRNHENNQKTNLNIDTNSDTILDMIFKKNNLDFRPN